MSTANPDDAKQVNTSEQPKPDSNRTVEPDKPDRNRTVKKASYGKTDVRYWPAKLKKRSYKGPDGKLVQIPEWQVRLFSGGREAWFNLGTPNKDFAAAKARDIFLSIQASGWDATLAQYKPSAEATDVKAEPPTIGEFLRAVETTSGLKTKTFKDYAQALRTIAAGVFKITSTVDKYDYVGGGRNRWLARIESIKLDKLSPTRIQAWKVEHLKQFEADPIKQARAKRTMNSNIRCAKALFAPGLLKFISSLQLTSPLPFDGIAFEKAGSMRYVSKINPALLLATAKRELAQDHPEQYKALILALCCGLRKKEIDTLCWDQINWDQQTIWIGRTEHFVPKTSESEASIDVDPELLDELRQYMKQATSPFVIKSHLPAKPGCTHNYFRAEHEFLALNSWLRSKGVDSLRPLHEMRKEFGAQLTSFHGIYAASRSLRHTSIQITSAFYADKKNRATIGMGKLLADGLKVVDADAPTADAPTTKAQSA